LFGIVGPKAEAATVETDRSGGAFHIADTTIPAKTTKATIHGTRLLADGVAAFFTFLFVVRLIEICSIAFYVILAALLVA
jgi:hypothetical protein